MKIEKVNENQIRCTLTKADLADRELKISELAYGTEKAKSLFRDMMQQASYEFGFDAEDIPLMIEAIPLNSECIVLVITKVEDPEELHDSPSLHLLYMIQIMKTMTMNPETVWILFCRVSPRVLMMFWICSRKYMIPRFLILYQIQLLLQPIIPSPIRLLHIL